MQDYLLLKNVWLGQLLTHRLLVSCGLVFRKEGEEVSGVMPRVGLFLPSGARMRGNCCVRTSSFAEGKAGRGLGVLNWRKVSVTTKGSLEREGGPCVVARRMLSG